jgi:hypothetical protein
VDSHDQRTTKPTLVFTEEAFLTTHSHILKRRLREVGINPDKPFETNYRVIAGQMCVEIKEKDNENDSK